MTDSGHIVLSLLRLCTGGSLEDFPRRESYDWNEVLDLCVRNGIAALVWDGMQRLYDNHIFDAGTMEQPLMDEWTSWIMSTEQDWRLMKLQADRLSRFFSSHDIPMMVLKGYGTSLDWPDPSHRTSGDLDIWLFGKSQEADTLLSKEKGIEVNNDHHHHTVFILKDRLVENHYDFVNTASHRSNRPYERRLKELAMLDRAVPCDGFYIPGPQLEALFNLRHMALHFAAVGCTLRHLMDWGFMAAAHREQIDWEEVIRISQEAGMYRFLCALDTICVEDLGFDAACFPILERERVLADRILDDILDPEFKERLPRHLIPGLFFKYRRWKAAWWKHDIVFSDSKVDTFFTQFKAHLAKPASLRES
jgi:hypothetical protein